MRDFLSLVAGTASVSLKAYETLVESASVADWVAEALKPEATASLRGFAAVAITAIHKNKPSDQNLQDAIPFLAAATTWNGASTSDLSFRLIFLNFDLNLPAYWYIISAEMYFIFAKSND